MRCPYCQQPVAVDAADCAECKLTFPRACVLLGAALRLTPLVADTTRTLALAEHHRLKRRLRKIQERFPQLVPQVVVHHFPAEHPFSTHVFWLFNTANLAGDSRRGSDNHSLMIVLDPSRGEAAMIPGYGLEVFLTDDALDHLLGLAAEHWETGRWTEGLLRVLDGLDAWLETIALPTGGAAFGKSEY